MWEIHFGLGRISDMVIFGNYRNRCSMRSFFYVLCLLISDFLSYVLWLLYLPHRFPNNLISCHWDRWSVQHLDFSHKLYNSSLLHFSQPQPHLGRFWSSNYFISVISNSELPLSLHNLWSFNSPAPLFTLNLLSSPHIATLDTLTLPNSQCYSCLSLPSCSPETPQRAMTLMVALISLNSTLFDFATCSPSLSPPWVIPVTCFLSVWTLIVVEERHGHLLTRWPTE